MINKKDIIEKLRDDTHYYGEFGQQYLSNSKIKTLLENPLAFNEPQESNSNFIIGSYFHTSILEPEKKENFKVIDSSTRTTKIYKEESGGEMCLLLKEKEAVDTMVEKVMNIKALNRLIKGSDNIEYEVPNIVDLFGNKWKGKADIVNHDEKLIVDLKTTSNINNFEWSARDYNYDSQAWLYKQMFGYDMVFIVIDKNTLQTGYFECSEEFLSRGMEKAKKASGGYDLFFKNEDFNSEQFFINRTL